ncbi:MAG: type II toxin-antitoxin system HicA family toxin [Verrucomicrobiae bacterium]|nr:type II toxin-antitoxin system HicA family toxin [Verrucomicrobiae bacterium]
MKTPRDVSANDLVKALRSLGYERVRQDGSHIRLTTQQHGEHHITIPNHASLRVGTFRSILKLVAAHHGITVEQLMLSLEL